ncbi:MAG: alginate export family protein [Candidatus Kapaibacteriota bacterium]
MYVRYTFATGGKTQNGINRKFEPVFGAYDKYYVWMNVVQWSNLKNPEIVLELFPIPKIWMEIKYLWFFVNDTNEKILGLKVGPSKYLGNEFDIFINHNANRNLKLTGVFGLFLVRDAYTSTSIKPNNALFSSFQLLYHISKI